MTARRPLPAWIWDRILAPCARLCGLCSGATWRSGPWTVCPGCDRVSGTPLPPNYA
jgi:hypothetical protein